MNRGEIRSGRLSTTWMEEYIHAVDVLIRDDRGIPLAPVAEIVGISYGSVEADDALGTVNFVRVG